MENVEPLAQSDEERAVIEADRQARNDREKARFNEHADKLRGIWE